MRRSDRTKAIIPPADEVSRIAAVYLDLHKTAPSAACAKLLVATRPLLAAVRLKQVE
jgi:hypothetical protein